jgi:transposase
VDECGIKEHLKREYGRAFRGVKVEDTKRGRKLHRVNIVAAESCNKNKVKRFAPMCYHGSMNGERFEEWFKSSLLKSIGKDSVIIMDNASFHRKKELEKTCKEAKTGLLFLPPYSPDFNPIEKVWANMKRNLRDTAPIYDLLQTAIYKYFIDYS